MTSTISSKKETTINKGKSMLFWAIRRNTAPMIVLTVLLTVALPLATIFIRTMFNSYTGDVSDINFGEREEYILRASVGIIYDTAVTLAAMVFSVIFAIGAFKYMHNKRTVDMFGSLPVNRRAMFFSQLASAVVCTLLPLAASTVLVMLCAIPYGSLVLSLLNEFLYLSLAVIANIAFIGLLSVCCGTVKDTMISYVTISVVYPLTVAFCVNLPSMMITGITSANVDMVMATALCPFAAPFVIFAYAGFGVALLRYSLLDVVYSYDMTSSYYIPEFSTDKAVCIEHIVYWILFTAVCILLSYFLIRKRRAEVAQSGFAFSLPQAVIRIMADFIAGLIAGEILLSVSTAIAPDNTALQYFWFFVGMLVGSLSAHLLLHVLYFKGFKGFAKSLIYFGSTAVITAVMFVVLVTGAFGTDVYVPNVDDVKSVIFYYSDGGGDGYDQDYDYMGTYDQVAGSSDKEYIKLVEGLHGMITSGIRQSDIYPYRLNKTYTNDYYSYSYQIIIEYKLKNGQSVKRVYNSSELGPLYKETSDKLKLSEMIEEITQTEAYHRSVSGIDNLDNARYVNSFDITISGDENEYYDDYNYMYNTYVVQTEFIGEKKLKELIKALKEEIPASTRPITGEKTGVLIRFNYIDENGLHNFTREIAIKETYKNTIALLEKSGLLNEEICKAYGDYCNSETLKYPDDYLSAASKGEYLYIKAPKDFAQRDNVYCRPYYDGGRIITKPLSIDEKCEYVSDGIYRIKLYDRIREYGISLDLTEVSVYTFDGEDVGKTYKSTNTENYKMLNGKVEVEKSGFGDYVLSI